MLGRFIYYFLDNRFCDLNTLHILIKHDLFKDSEAHFIVGIGNVHDHATAKTGAKPFFKNGGFVWWAIGRKNDLLIVIIQRIKCVEKLFFTCRLSCYELNIVDNKHVNRAVYALHILHTPVLYGKDDVVYELFRRNIFNLKIIAMGLTDLIAYGLHQMGLSKAGTTVDE